MMSDKDVKPARFDQCWVATTRDALQLLARKWTLAIVGELRGGPKRLFELKAALRGVHTKVLRESLLSLEADGIVERCLWRDTSDNVGVAYRLTSDGRSIFEVFDVVFEWWSRHDRDRRSSA